MSSPTILLQDSIASIKQERYSDAIQSLEAFCRRYATSHFKEYVKAQTWLIKAYQANGQLEQAIALCHRLSANKNPQVRALAQRILPSLADTTVIQRRSKDPSLEAPEDATVVQYRPDARKPSDAPDDATVMQARKPAPDKTVAQAYSPPEDATILQAPGVQTAQVRPEQAISERDFQMQSRSLQTAATEKTTAPEKNVPSPSQQAAALSGQEAEELLAKGHKALKYGRYREAVQALEAFCEIADPITKTYTSAQKSLVKAYKGSKRLEDAAALCRELISHDQEIIQIWAQEYLRSLKPEEPVKTSSTSEEKTVWSAGQVNPLSQSRTEESTRVIRAKRMKRRILSVTCYGAVAFSILLLPGLVPLGILKTTQDDTVRRNAKEALNFFCWVWSCWVLIGMATLACSFFLPLGVLRAVMGGFAIGIGVLGMALCAIAVLASITKPSTPYYYPFIWRVF